jgi:hypothetical protein
MDDAAFSKAALPSIKFPGIAFSSAVKLSKDAVFCCLYRLNQRN